MQLVRAKEVDGCVTECCCTCLYNKRVLREEGSFLVDCICKKDGKYIGYLQSFENKCRAWKADPWQLRR